MDWTKLFSMQQELDRHIEENHNVDKTTIFDSKFLALLVELGELANETRCFKFWSTKAPSDKETILEEYVDGLHFILSLGLEKGYRYESRYNSISKEDPTRQFNQMFSLCVKFQEVPSLSNYTNMFECFLDLGTVLGFDEQEIMGAYHKKNEKNYVRQEQGY